MKHTRLLSVLLAFCLIFSTMTALTISVSAEFTSPDSLNWENLTDREASDLLRGAANNNGAESFIFVFYRDNCFNSQNALPRLLNYAQQNNLKFRALNANEAPSWFDWAEFVDSGSIGFPFILAYNADKKLYYCEDNVFTVDALKGILAAVEYGSAASSTPKNQVFSDVPVTSSYFEATKNLSEKGIINGYEDGTFAPNNTINRAEAATVISRAAGLSPILGGSTYYDVPVEHWAVGYVNAVADAGIINGVGDGFFAPNNNVTRQQILKMIVCMAGKQQAAEQAGGWPIGYILTAVELGIAPAGEYSILCSNTYGGAAASRGEVALYIYKLFSSGAWTPPSNQGAAPKPESSAEGLYVNGVKYIYGMSVYSLPDADVVVPSTCGFDWYIYDTKDYDNFVAVGAVMDMAVALVAIGKGFTYNGYRAGDVIDGRADSAGLLTDKNDNNIIHGFFNYMDGYDPRNANVFTAEALRGEGTMNFHCVNAFRVYHGLKPFEWSEQAYISAREHSQDMANNNYFDHQSLDGRSSGDRMKDVGITWWSCGENIAAGRSTGVENYNSWVNSAGHRKNILSDFTYLGAALAYNPNSEYKFYSTQNFYSRHASGNIWDTFN